MSETAPLVIPDLEDSRGTRIELPVDTAAVAEFTGLFAQLTIRQQNWLIIRFLGDCETDEEATRALNRRAEAKTEDGVAKGTLGDTKLVAAETARKWKQNNAVFRRSYDLMASRMVKWAEALVLDIERGNAVLGAIEMRSLLQTPWSELDSRGKTAKEHAAQSSLDRVVGRKTTVTGEVRVEDLIPRE